MQNDWPVPQIDSERCSGCGRCVTACPHGVLALADGVATVIAAHLCQYDGCCELVCEPGAIYRPIMITVSQPADNNPSIHSTEKRT